MEVVAISHGNFKHGMPIVGFNGLLNVLESFFDNMLNTMLKIRDENFRRKKESYLEEFTSSCSQVHTTSAWDFLLFRS